MVHHDINSFEDGFVFRVPDSGFIDFQDRSGQHLRGGEDEYHLRVREDVVNFVHLFKNLDPRLHQAGSLVVGSELVNELLDVRNLGLLLVELLLLVLVPVCSGSLEVIVVTGVVLELHVEEMDDLVACRIQELS